MWDYIIVAGIDKYSVITDLAVAAFAIVTTKHDNDWNMTKIGILKL
jgi:hypothetical protein